MISYYDGQLTDIMPSNITKQPEIQALSYALQQATQLLYRYNQRLYIYSKIEEQPEQIIDLLAAELRTQYYKSTLDLKTKRQLVKNTLIWYMTAGTPAAVEELVTTIYGKGKVTEWFEYGGKPYHFKIDVTNIEVDAEKNKEFKRLLNQIKRTSAHLDVICYKFEDMIRNLIYYKNIIQINSKFYPRFNVPYVQYNGLERYDGSVRYDRYKTKKRINLYPIKLLMKSEINPSIFFYSKLQMKNIFSVSVQTEHKIIYKNDFNINKKIKTKIKMTQENVVIPHYQMQLKIGKHPNRYDGSVRYNGQKQYYVEREEILQGSDMMSKTNLIMTLIGREKLCKAHAGDRTLPSIKWVAYGTGGVDENRQPLVVTGEETALRQEEYRTEVKHSFPLPTTCEYTATLDEEIMPNMYISEKGFFDEEGDLVMYGTFMEKGKDDDMIFQFNTQEIF